jgi:DNA-binding transcriptional ArsR family regulator
MSTFDVLSDPVRRRILELLAVGETTSGGVTEVIRQEFGISQPAVSAQLRVLREAGFATVRQQGPRRLYALDPEPLRAAEAWLDRFRGFWDQRLDALGTEVARGKRQRARPRPRKGESVDSSRSADQGHATRGPDRRGRRQAGARRSTHPGL